MGGIGVIVVVALIAAWRALGSTPADEQAIAALRPLATQRGGKLWVVFGCGGNRDAGKRPRMAALAQDLADQLESKRVTVIDVREPMEYASGHIAGSLNVPLARLQQADLPQGPLVLVCQSGNRSAIDCCPRIISIVSLQSIHCIFRLTDFHFWSSLFWWQHCIICHNNLLFSLSRCWRWCGSCFQ
jgi:hypothetical protein